MIGGLLGRVMRHPVGWFTVVGLYGLFLYWASRG